MIKIPITLNILVLSVLLTFSLSFMLEIGEIQWFHKISVYYGRNVIAEQLQFTTTVRVHIMEDQEDYGSRN